MEVFVQNIPPQINNQELRTFFRKELQPFGCDAFSCEKFKNKGCAKLTIFDASIGRQFIDTFGSTKLSLLCRGQVLQCRVDRHNNPNPLLMECLAKEDAERKQKRKHTTEHGRGHTVLKSARHTFEISQLDCGFWGYRYNSLIFYSCYHDLRVGHLILGRKGLVVLQHKSAGLEKNVRMNIPYYTVDSVTVGEGSDPTVTLALSQAPVFWEVANHEGFPDDDPLNFRALSLSPYKSSRTTQYDKFRVCNFHPTHAVAASCCFVYRLKLSDPAHTRLIQQMLNAPGAPGSMMWITSSRMHNDFKNEIEALKQDLQRNDRFGHLPFAVQFQVQRLAQNGYLKPSTVIKLLPVLQGLCNDVHTNAVAEAIRKLAKDMPYSGPAVQSELYSIGNLVDSVKRYAFEFKYAGSVYDQLHRHPHLGLIHQVKVTPAGMYLEGPELMTKNRVLRKYPANIDSFLRVTFCDEDGDRLQMPYGVSNEKIFCDRFKKVLNGTIEIAGRLFVFLGFSHSSLREQTCWFQSPFLSGNGLKYATHIIKDLGDFSLIRSPAKCAARIGQAFSDTTDYIRISPEAAINIPDIERNDRCFTDGVGKISAELLQRVWKEFTRSRKQKATLLQIRYKGAKGMLALDPLLNGEQVCLRNSMIKFEGSKDDNLEICGAAYKPLPMFLNRDFVKILEDLGVNPAAFLALQDNAVKRLEDVIQNYLNAAHFLEANRIATTPQTPSLIKSMGYHGIRFHNDEFLENIVHLAAVTQLRDMKYRARIPVEQGFTLHGIADETGIIAEDEVYIATRDLHTNARRVSEGYVLVTRSPARHPGDIRIAKAINVAATSPLATLHNCIVFSQHGKRDMPSQLSGGDLDGDLYNIIFERSLWPTNLALPADYPRLSPLDIGREVIAADIVDFFVTFMSTDCLGRICNIHTQIADQKPSGVFDDVCLRLAGMASTAVDYSKTGIPVDLSQLPRDSDYQRRMKPDFMAEGPRVAITDTVTVEDNEDDNDEPDAVGILDPDTRPVRYYKSKKVLGQLYRAIDERQFLATMHRRAREDKAADGQLPGRTPMNQLWDYVQRTTLNIQWSHHKDLARRIREGYEETLADTMYQYSLHPKYPISELEVFCGTILGKSGGLPGKRTRDSSMDMKEKFARDVAFTLDWIRVGDSNNSIVAGADDAEIIRQVVDFGGTKETMERAIACFAVAMEEEGKRVAGAGLLKSFKYVAAAFCMQEVARFRGFYGVR